MSFRWGVFGTGEVARKFALGLRAVEGAEVAWIASRDAGRAARLAAAVGAPRGIGGYAEAAAAGADAIYVASPPTLHAEHAALAFARGIPALVEKPFAASGADAGAIAEGARAAGVFCMEAMWTRFLPATRGAFAAVRAGEIGAPRMLRGEFCIAASRAGAPTRFDPALGGGALLDRGVYPLSLAWALFGPPVRATAEIRRGESGVDEDAAVTLVHAGGEISQLRASLAVTGETGLEVLGEGGALALEGPVFRPWGWRVRRASSGGGGGGGGRLAALRETPFAQALQRRLSRWRGPRWRRVAAPYAGNGYGHEARALMDHVRAGDPESDVMPLDESVAIVEAMARLLEEGRA